MLSEIRQRDIATIERYVQSLEKILKWKMNSEARSILVSRMLHIMVSRAHYGRPSAVLIEFEGSPPQFRVFIDCLQYDTFAQSAIVDGKVLRRVRALPLLVECAGQLLFDLGLIDHADFRKAVRANEGRSQCWLV